MTPEDRELLQTLRLQQLDLQRSLARLDAQLQELEGRANVAAAVPPSLPAELFSELPPIPFHTDLPPLPPERETTVSLSPHEANAEQPAHDLPPLPSAAAIPSPSFEFQLGRWLTRVGAVFFVLSIVFFAIWADVNYHLHQRLGPGGKLGLMGLVSVVVVALGQRLERKNASLTFFGRTLMAAGLGGLYFTLYAAHYLEPLRVIRSPVIGGLLLLSWSIYVFLLAERKKSQALSLFAITLAYVSSAMTPVGAFTMIADLGLAATAVLFLVRNGWATLTYFSLAGTYLALLRRLVVDEDGEFALDTSRTLHFWPHATYLFGAWVIFTAAVILSTAATFRGGKRLAFLSLNNGAWAGLLVLTTYCAGYGAGSMGWSLLDAGLVLLLASRFAGWSRVEPHDVMAAYAAQGLALVTAGVMVVYTGITRGVLLVLETFFLGAAAAFARDRILIVTTHVAGFFAALFLTWEIAVKAHHPWLLGFGGAAVLLLNAWWSRGDIRRSPKARSTIVLSSSYYIALALGLIFTAMSTALSDEALPPALALAGLTLTFSIYLVSLYELPALAQTFLLGAQALVLFPAESGEALPWWSTSGVAATTLVILTWWTRQRITRTGLWTAVLTFVYALALVGLTYDAIRPYVDSQGWMIGASLLSVAFLTFGAFSRVWPIAVTGQLFLAVALYHFCFPPGGWETFPWTWWAAAVPIAVVFSTARAAHEWLRLFTEIPESARYQLRTLAYAYQLISLAMLIRWVFAVIPQTHQIETFLFLGTFLLLWNRERSRSFGDSGIDHGPTPGSVPPEARAGTFGIRCSYLLSLTGLSLYVENLQVHAQAMATFANGMAFLLFLLQPAMLRFGNKAITQPERWTLILLSAGAGWLFVSNWVGARFQPHDLTMGWALYALFLFLFGLFFRERRFRWCGLAVLLAAIVRVFVCDFWGFSSGYRVLTFIVLTIITLGLGFIYARFGDRLKTWL